MFDILTKQARSFLIVGLINTLFSYIIYSIFLYAGLDYKLSVLLSTILGVFFSFRTLGTFVFHNNDKKLIYRFIVLYSLIYFLNITLIKFFYNLVYNYYLAGGFAIVICAIVSFIFNKYFVFKKKCTF